MRHRQDSIRIMSIISYERRLIYQMEKMQLTWNECSKQNLQQIETYKA